MPGQGNIKQWANNLYTKFRPIEQERWNQSNIDSLFYAGSQNFVNRHFNFAPSASQSYYFNLVQQPVNLITGYQRQHRKSITYVPAQGSDSETTDQYTKLIMSNNNRTGVNDAFSKGCEQSAIAGMVLAQPYLDYNDDPAQGDIKLKIWEYNSFIVDPFFREPDMSDANFVWTQEFISKEEAESRFPDRIDEIKPLSGSPNTFGNFYFLPENQSMARDDLLILSYIWYKTRRKRKKLYSKKINQFFDFSQKNAPMQELMRAIPDLQLVTVTVPTWNVAVLLNDREMYNGHNPLDFDRCPFVPIFWNYEPHLSYYDLRVRSLVRPMRDPQFLMNYKIITNNDIAAATINAGWKRKIGAVANEDNLKKSQAGWDVIINDGFEMTDVEKIIPTAVPQSDLALAEQMSELIFKTSGMNLENWSGQQDAQISSLTLMMKQSANLMVFQKYFDQWDTALKLVGELELDIALNNWNESKVHMLIEEEPSQMFFASMFAKYNTLVEEGLNTPTQRNIQAQSMLDINAAFGREVFPPSMVIKDMNIQGRNEMMQFLQQQEQQTAAAQQDMQDIQHAFEDAKLKEMYSRATANIAMARERHGRSESNIGLFEERLSQISTNRSMATKNKVEALQKLVEIIAQYGAAETAMSATALDNQNEKQVLEEDREKVDAHKTALANTFEESIMGLNQGMQVPTNNEAML